MKVFLQRQAYRDYYLTYDNIWYSAWWFRRLIVISGKIKQSTSIRKKRHLGLDNDLYLTSILVLSKVRSTIPTTLLTTLAFVCSSTFMLMCVDILLLECVSWPWTKHEKKAGKISDNRITIETRRYKAK